MSALLQLEGRVEPEETQELRRKIARLESDLEHSDEILREAKARAAGVEHRLAPVKRQLQPLYDALRQLFGELEVVGDVSAAAPTAAVSSRASAVWATWKDKLGGKQAAIIDALLLGSMTREQMKIATRSGWSTVDQTLTKLRNLGLVVKDSEGKWKLKDV